MPAGSARYGAGGVVRPSPPGCRTTPASVRRAGVEGDASGVPVARAGHRGPSGPGSCARTAAAALHPRHPGAGGQPAGTGRAAGRAGLAGPPPAPLPRRTEVNADPRVALLARARARGSGRGLADAGSPEGRERLRQGLTEARLTAIEDRVDARLRLGRHAELLDELVGLVAAEPVRERLAGQLMLALHRGGQTSEALAVYQRIRRRLADEFGLDPGTGLRRLDAEILRGGASVDPEPVAPVGTGTTRDRAGIRVLLVDDHPLFRTGLRVALAAATAIPVGAARRPAERPTARRPAERRTAGPGGWMARSAATAAGAPGAAPDRPDRPAVLPRDPPEVRGVGPGTHRYHRGCGEG